MMVQLTNNVCKCYDCVRIQFNMLDYRKVIKYILKLKFNRFIFEDYDVLTKYVYSSISVIAFRDNGKRTALIEMDSMGCRLFEGMLRAQNRTWDEFFLDCAKAKGIFKKINTEIIVY